MRNPFLEDIFAEGAAAGDSEVPPLHAEALDRLNEALPPADGVLGRAMVLSAPRAGFGKTHLVHRFAAGLLGRAIILPLTFDLEREPRWHSVLWDSLEKLHRDQGHRSGLTLLDEAARFLFALANQRLIETRQIPCAHPAEAIAALDRNYLEMFDFTNPEQPVAKWFGDHFERLMPLTSNGLAPLAQVEPNAAAHWLRALCSYAQGAGELPSKRLETLRWAISQTSGPAFVEGPFTIVQESGSPEFVAKERFRDLGRLLGLYRPLIFVIDHLDVFHRDTRAGLHIAYFVSELRRLFPRSLTAVCANQDLWESTFRNHLPSALEDRMTGGFVLLRGLSPAQADALLRQRMATEQVPEDVAERFVASLRLPDFFARQAGRSVSPRALLRHAAERWEAFSAEPVENKPSAPVFPADSVAEMPGLSVVGAEALDSISQAIEAMAREAEARTEAVEASPTAEDPKHAFRRLRERLERMRQPRPAPTEPAHSAGNAPSPAAPAPEAPAAASPPATEGGSLSDAFATRLQHHAGAPVVPALDPERLGALLRFAGLHFPVVRAAEVSIPGTSGTAIQWLSPDSEILFALEPPTRPTFWSALSAHAGNRAAQNGGLAVKVVAFSEKPVGNHPLEHSLPAQGAVTADIVEPTVAERAALAAAGDLLDGHGQSPQATTDADLAALFAVELDAFWRRITRLPAPGPKPASV